MDECNVEDDDAVITSSFLCILYHPHGDALKPAYYSILFYFPVLAAFKMQSRLFALHHCHMYHRK